MHRGDNLLSFFRLRLTGNQHVRTFLPNIEILMQMLFHDCRGERTKIFPKFDMGIDMIFHVSRVWPRKDAAIPQRARPEFRPSLIPCDDFAVFQALRGFSIQVVGFRIR